LTLDEAVSKFGKAAKDKLNNPGAHVGHLDQGIGRVRETALMHGRHQLALASGDSSSSQMLEASVLILCIHEEEDGSQYHARRIRDCFDHAKGFNSATDSIRRKRTS